MFRWIRRRSSSISLRVRCLVCAKTNKITYIWSDGDFRVRHEQAIRNIGQLKNEVDALRA
jgi:chromosome segregation ATPase